MTDRIPDCSNYQGMIDWAQVVSSGRVGGIVKATEGLNFVDGQFIRNWTALGKMGAARGAYHFARPGSSTPEQQADRFTQIVATWKPGDLLILDLEVGDGDLSGWALGWLNRVRATTGLTPWLYSYGPFIRAHLTSPQLARFPLWLAAYQTSPPPCPPPWTSYQLWQLTDKAIIPGISGPCDESVGTLDNPPISEAKAMARIPNPIPGSARRRPGFGPEQFGIMAADGSMWMYNGAPYVDAYNAHSELWGGPAPTSVRGPIGFEWDPDGWGYTQYFDDGAHYDWRAAGH